MLLLIVLSSLCTLAARAETRLQGSLPDQLGRFQIDRPAGWQSGDRLIIYNHGFDLRPPDPTGAPATAPDEEVRQAWLQQGYALAAGSYAQGGWAMFNLERAQLALLAEVDQLIGTPGEIIVFGGSLGGLVSLKTAEFLHAAGRPAAGVLAACPVAGGARTWDQALDVRLLFDAVCPASPLPGGAEPLPWLLNLSDIPSSLSNIDDPDALLTLANAANRIRQCTGLFQPAIFDTEAQRQRKARLKALIGVNSDDFLKIQLSYALYALSDLVRQPGKLNGFHGLGNASIDYGDADANQLIRRVERDQLAAVKLGAVSDLTGRWGATKVLAVHTDGDQLVFPEHLDALLQASGQATSSAVSAVVREAAPSHCGFSRAELLAAFSSLRDWIDSEQRPTVAELQSRCQAGAGSERCAYDADYQVAPLSSRIRARPATDDQVNADHSGAWFDPAFDGEGWIVEVLPGGLDATVTWYTYPDSGSDDQQAWIVGRGRISADGIHVADAYRYRGARFGAEFDPAAVQGQRWGELTLAFDRCGEGDGPYGQGSLRYRRADGQLGERSLIQLTVNARTPSHCLVFIQPPQPSAESRYSGSWFRGPAAPGEGIQFQVDDLGRGVLIWYSYDPQGRPAWMIGAAEREVSAGRWRFSLQRPRGTGFGDEMTPADVQRLPWGEAELEFSSCDQAVLRWTPSEPGWAAGEQSLVRLTLPAGNADCE
ncbi:hypothetical protein [Pseudomarimonas arenosa]|uniref:Uncharacterized protein n=1 Tax=Pseudomarimonas arenosa TaxID=2774145 RepID=A0AAW3ZQ31_9GAMM|nr:hypothetical protein [Pseudomarimonas arenosa]MBD8528058.1 hypothetical protein [Pseudomarimonas arenosa]